MQDQVGTPALILESLVRIPTVEKVFADGGYAGPKLAGRLRWLRLSELIEIYEKPRKTTGFAILSRL